MFVEVILSQRFPKHLGVFDYSVPTELEKEIALGQLVSIPFRSSLREGVVVRLKKTSISGKKIKQLTSIINTTPILTSQQLQLAEWIASYYIISSGTVIKTMLPPIPKKTHTIKAPKINFAQPPENKAVDQLIPLIQTSKDNRFAFTPSLHSDTLRFYHTLIADRRGSILIVTPTIEDTKTIQSIVPTNDQPHTVVIHSKLNKNQMYDAWNKVMNDNKSIVIGTKQALFAPFNLLSLIVIDQESNQNHKQSEQNPRFDSRDVVQQLQQLHGAKVISVDPAPTVLLYNDILSKSVTHLTIPSPTQPTLTVIDMREERRAQNYGLFSDKLKRDIKHSLDTNGKIFLFINKRGTSSAVMCKDCGHVLTCPKCRTTTAYHEKSDSLFCHRCNTKSELPPFCPKCNGANLKMIGSGTQSIEKEINKLWPQILTARYDADSNSKPTKDVRIIVGTIRAFSILPWSEIKLIGIISADTLLHLPDYRAQERTWQLLHQFTYHADAPLVIQTHSPDNNAIKSFAKHDAAHFYQTELEDRAMLEYPPKGRLIKLIFSHQDKGTMVNETNRLYTQLAATPLTISKITPLTPYSHGKWHMYVIIKHTDDTPAKVITGVLKKVPEGWQIDRDPENLL